MSLPKEHPSIPPKKVGVLLVNLGTPEDTDYFSIRRYLSEFLSDKRVIDYPSWLWQPLLQGVILTSRPFRSGAAYKKIWDKKHNASPLRVYTESLTRNIKDAFADKDSLYIDYAMRYGKPSIEEKIQNMLQKGCQKLLIIALYPQYSATTMASVYDKAFDVLKKATWQPAIRTMPTFHDHPAYIKALGEITQKKLTAMDKAPDMIMTSFHGLPKRYLTQGDPYHCLCHKTSRLLQEYLNWPKDKWVTTFQSRFGPEQWLEPYTDKTLESLAQKGVKNIALLSPAFICDCIETLEEIQIEAKETFMNAGGETLTYIPCLNDGTEAVALFKTLIENELQGWL